MSVTIGVVGGGTAGACLINALAEQLSNRGNTVSVEIVVFDDTDLWWRGRVYQPDGEYVWSNVPMSGMSVRHHDPGHGLSWLRAMGRAAFDPLTGHPAFVSRPAYGDYLDAATNDAIARLAACGWRVDVVAERVVGLARDGRSVRLKTSSGRYYELDSVVLAAGGSAYADTYRLSGAPGYLPDPYPLGTRLAGIPQGHRVGILGTGLAAVDVAVALAAHGHTGPIDMFGRTGLLPAARGAETTYEPVHLTVSRVQRAAGDGLLSLTTVRRLIEAELHTAGSSLNHVLRVLLPQPPLTRLSAQLDARDTSSDIGPQVLQKAVPLVGQDLWYLLAPDAQRWVLDHLHRAVMTLCCPMPLVNATRIAALLSTGQLTVHSGITAARPGQRGGHTVDTADGPVHTDVLVNTVTPARRAIPRPARALVHQATASDQLHRHPLGGVQVERHTSRALTPHRRPHSRIHVLGELTSGAFYFISGMPVLVKRSADIADSLIRQLARDTTSTTQSQRSSQ